MTRTTNPRVAGFTFLLYIALGVPALILFDRAASGEGIAAKLAGTATAHALGAFLLKVRGWNPTIAAAFFAVGSTLFSWLLLRGRMIPVLLAWLGVAASALLVVGLPLQLAGFIAGPGPRQSPVD